MKKNKKLESIRRKKVIRVFFVMIICVLCGIMYTRKSETSTIEVHVDESIKKHENVEGAKGTDETKETEKLTGTEEAKGTDETKSIKETGESKKDTPLQEERIDINKASAGELMELNGIGESKAAAVVAYRERNGSFAQIEDIMKVPGIKEGTFAKIKDRIKVN